jgi:hypothetical protein
MSAGVTSGFAGSVRMHGNIIDNNAVEASSRDAIRRTGRARVSVTAPVETSVVMVFPGVMSAPAQSLLGIPTACHWDKLPHLKLPHLMPRQDESFERRGVEVVNDAGDIALVLSVRQLDPRVQTTSSRCGPS